MKEYEIGKKLKSIREESNMSQSHVVAGLKEEGIHMSRETLSKIENYARSISAIELNALCKVLNVDIGDFFQENKDDIVTFFRKRNFSENALNEIHGLQEMVKVFIRQEKIYKQEGN